MILHCLQCKVDIPRNTCLGKSFKIYFLAYCNIKYQGINLLQKEKVIPNIGHTRVYRRGLTVSFQKKPKCLKKNINNLN